MPTDDVQDLFDTGGEDEGEEPTDATEEDSETDEDGVAWDELESIDDDAGEGPAESDGASRSGSSGAPTGGAGAEDRPTSASGQSAGGGADGEDPSMDWSSPDDEPAEDAAGAARSTRRTEATDTDGSPESSATAGAERADAGDGSAARSQDRERQQDDPAGSGSNAAATDATSWHGGLDVNDTSGGPDPATAESSSPDGRAEEPSPEPSPGPDPEQSPPDIDSADGTTESASTESASSGTGTADTETASAGTAGSSRLPTGIDALDEAMGGGVPPGRLVLLVADPGVQSELIVDSVLAQRDTLFISTDRPDWEVSKDIEPGLGSGEVEVRDHTPDSLLSGVDSLLDELGTSSNFVLDSVNELELVPRARYRIFLSDVKRRLFDTGSIGLLTGVTVDHESARDLTLRRADIVWRLQTRTVDHRIENRLSVPKFRGGAAVAETVKLELTDEVKVDSAWDQG